MPGRGRNGPPASSAAGRSGCGPWFLSGPSRRTSAAHHRAQAPRGSARCRPACRQAQARPAARICRRAARPIGRRSRFRRHASPGRGGRSATFVSTSGVCTWLSQRCRPCENTIQMPVPARSQVASWNCGASPGSVDRAQATHWQGGARSPRISMIAASSIQSVRRTPPLSMCRPSPRRCARVGAPRRLRDARNELAGGRQPAGRVDRIAPAHRPASRSHPRATHQASRCRRVA